jgi:hypothetical protein
MNPNEFSRDFVLVAAGGAVSLVTTIVVILLFNWLNWVNEWRAGRGARPPEGGGLASPTLPSSSNPSTSGGAEKEKLDTD